MASAELVEWARSKGLKELLPGMLLEESFADGRLLCRLVGLLERKTLSGIEWRAPSVAASRHNVTKVSSALLQLCFVSDWESHIVLAEACLMHRS